MLDLSDYYSGGYFLVKARPIEWEGADTSLLPAKIVSLSRCIADVLEVVWGWGNEDQARVRRFGIPEEKFADFSAWASRDFETLIALKGFRSVEAAREIIKRFSIDTTDLYLIGASLPKAFEAINWREPTDEEFRFPNIEKRIEQHLPIEAGGKPLGFEVLGHSNGQIAHSWLCNSLWIDMYELFAIRPNQYGLIDDYEDAKKVYDWIYEDENDERAEPEPYDAWMLMSYTLE